MRPKVWRDVGGWTVSVGLIDIARGLTWSRAIYIARSIAA